MEMGKKRTESDSGRARKTSRNQEDTKKKPDNAPAKKLKKKPDIDPLSEGSTHNFPIVGIGASAGGLGAFKKLFSKMPPSSGCAFVLIPHLDPKHESLMVELISRQTHMT